MAILRSQEIKAPAKEIAGGHLLALPSKRISPQSTHKQTKYFYREQSFTKAGPQRGGEEVKFRLNILFRRNINNTIRREEGYLPTIP